MADDIAFVDAETASDLSVTDVGSYRYARSPETRPILWSVLPNSSARSLVFETPDLYSILFSMREGRLLSWAKTKRAKPLYLLHWSPFDRLIQRELDRRAGIEWPTDEGDDSGGVWGPHNILWIDLSDMCMTTGLPAKLASAAAFRGVEVKDAGKRLIDLFCLPNEDGRFEDKHSKPIQWEQFRAYAAQDTMAMRPLFQLLVRNGYDPYPHRERAWVIRRMNETGVRVDVPAAAYAASCLDRAQAKAEAEVFDRYGFRTSQVARMVEFLDLPNAQKLTIEEALEKGVLDEDQQFVAEARLGLGGAARRKLKPMVAFADLDDDRIRGGYVHHGAWTGRLVSLGVQLQNFVRSPSREEFFTRLKEYDDADLLGLTRENLRGFLCADPLHTFVAGDYKAIELRVGAALAGEQWLVDTLAHGEDPYRVAAVYLGLAPAVDQCSDEQRQEGKIVELAGMFGQGPDGFQRSRAAKGDRRELADCQVVISTYRAAHPAFVRAWAEAGRAFARCVDSLEGAEVKALDVITLVRRKHAIEAIRPSGVSMWYWLPALVESEKGRDYDIVVASKDNQTGLMLQDRTWGSKLFQGWVQAISFDIIIEAMIRAARGGMKLVMNVHDEIVAEVREEQEREGLAQLEQFMLDGRAWTKGIPIAVSMWSSRRFTAK